MEGGEFKKPPAGQPASLVGSAAFPEAKIWNSLFESSVEQARKRLLSGESPACLINLSGFVRHAG
jgi:hypothetical protein